MARLVDACKAEVAVLAHLAVLNTIYDHSLVSCGAELLAMSVVDRKADSLATKPITWVRQQDSYIKCR